MSIGAFVEFDARRPSIRFDASKYGDRRLWAIGFELYFAKRWGETVRITSEEEELRYVDGRLGFGLINDETPKGEKGELNYFEGQPDDFHGYPSGYSVFLWLTQEEHDRLFGLVQSGVPLTKLSIDVGEGVEYGWEPDGNGKDWDNQKFPKVPIHGFDLQFGAPDNLAFDDDAEPSRSILEEPVAPDSFKSDALAKLNEMNRRLAWLLASLMIVGIIVAIQA